jgi:hypothetical protein
VEAGGVRPIVDELRKVKQERDALVAQLAKARADQSELSRLRGELSRKDEEIQRLTDELDVQILPSVADAPTRKPVALPPGTSQTVATALGTVQGPIEGCFREWAERTPGAFGDRFEAAMVVGLTITADGLGTLPRVLSTPEDPLPHGGKRGMSILEQCVSEQIARARFAPAAAGLSITATVLWSSNRVRMYPKTVGQRPVHGGASAGLIELR